MAAQPLRDRTSLLLPSFRLNRSCVSSNDRATTDVVRLWFPCLSIGASRPPESGPGSESPRTKTGFMSVVLSSQSPTGRDLHSPATTSIIRADLKWLMRPGLAFHWRTPRYQWGTQPQLQTVIHVASLKPCRRHLCSIRLTFCAPDCICPASLGAAPLQ